MAAGMGSKAADTESPPGDQLCPRPLSQCRRRCPWAHPRWHQSRGLRRGRGPKSLRTAGTNSSALSGVKTRQSPLTAKNPLQGDPAPRTVSRTCQCLGDSPGHVTSQSAVLGPEGGTLEKARPRGLLSDPCIPAALT